jgi:hypothetical protein
MQNTRVCLCVRMLKAVREGNLDVEDRGFLDRETSLDMKHLVLGDMDFGVNIEGHHVKVIWELAVQIW